MPRRPDASLSDTSASDASTADASTADASTREASASGADSGDSSALTITSNAPDAGIVGISVSPLALVPSFSPSISDYTVRCTGASNALTVTVTDTSGSQTATLDVAPDQEISVWGQYWVRCLPTDFPPITVTRPTSGSGPTPGYYLVNNGTYGIVLDTNGTPVWYSRAGRW